MNTETLTPIQKAASTIDAVLRTFNGAKKAVLTPEENTQLRQSLYGIYACVNQHVDEQQLNRLYLPMVVWPEDESHWTFNDVRRLIELGTTEIEKNIQLAHYRFIQALSYAIVAVQNTTAVTMDNDMTLIDGTLKGLAKCDKQLEQLAEAEQLDECALIIGQQTLGRKSMDVFQTRLDLSKMYLEDYKRTSNIELLAQAARHAEIAAEMSYYIFQSQGIDVCVVSEYSAKAVRNFWEVINAASADLSMRMFYINTFTSTYMVALERQLGQNKQSGTQPVEPSRH